MTEYAKPDWRTILLLLGAAGGGLLALTMIPLLLAYSLSGSAFSGHQSLNGPDVLQAMVLAASLAVVGALSFPAFHNSLRSLRGAAVARGGPPRLDVWQALLLIVIWLGASWLGQAVLGAGAWKWAAPALPRVGDRRARLLVGAPRGRRPRPRISDAQLGFVRHRDVA